MEMAEDSEADLYYPLSLLDLASVIKSLRTLTYGRS